MAAQLGTTLKQKQKNLHDFFSDVSLKQCLGFQYINESSVKFVQNNSKLIIKN